MNLILMDQGEEELQSLPIINDPRQVKHIKSVLRSQPGDRLRLGLLNGPMGFATIQGMEEASVQLTNIELNETPPPALPIKLLLAMPRPKMLKRILRTTAMFGVKEIHLFHSHKVEKAFWETPLLMDNQWNEYFKLGLEQARDTGLPSLQIHKRFKPFVEDIVPPLCHEYPLFLAHPGAKKNAPTAFTAPMTLVIGPEGGFTEYEVSMFEERNATTFNFGPRILRTEDALPALLARHQLFS